jgi:hypothetical protein
VCVCACLCVVNVWMVSISYLYFRQSRQRPSETASTLQTCTLHCRKYCAPTRRSQSTPQPAFPGHAAVFSHSKLASNDAQSSETVFFANAREKTVPLAVIFPRGGPKSVRTRAASDGGISDSGKTKYQCSCRVSTASERANNTQAKRTLACSRNQSRVRPDRTQPRRAVQVLKTLCFVG